MDGFEFIVDALAVHRLTRLVTSDRISRGLRAKIVRRAYSSDDGWDPTGAVSRMSDSQLDALPHSDDEAPLTAALIGCPWCVSIYVAAGAVVARRYLPALWRLVSAGLALSTAAALVSSRERP